MTINIDHVKKKQYIDNIKNTFAIRTKFKINHAYSDFIYGDFKNKICFAFTPRAGCSIGFQCYLDLMNLLNDGLTYHPFIHEYRTSLFIPNVKYVDIDILVKQKFFFIKFIMNPYIRAVSVFRQHTSRNYSFRQFITDLVNNNIDYYNTSEIYHHRPQYINGEEKYINKYIRINENETFNFKLQNHATYNIDLNKYSSIHHGKKNPDKNIFVGDIPLNDIKYNLPSSYKYFYDDDIKKKVETFYKDDVIKYNFKFDCF